jgi:hypothetical protein
MSCRSSEDDVLERILPDPPPGFVVQPHSSGVLPSSQRFPASTNGARSVQIRGDVVLTAMASRFDTSADAHESVEAFGKVLLSDLRHLIPLHGLDSLSEDARGAVASRAEETPGALVMVAWSVGSLRLDLSVSVLREDVTESSFWEVFPHERFDAIAGGMQARAALGT